MTTRRPDRPARAPAAATPGSVPNAHRRAPFIRFPAGLLPGHAGSPAGLPFLAGPERGIQLIGVISDQFPAGTVAAAAPPRACRAHRRVCPRSGTPAGSAEQAAQFFHDPAEPGTGRPGRPGAGGLGQRGVFLRGPGRPGQGRVARLVLDSDPSGFRRGADLTGRRGARSGAPPVIMLLIIRFSAGRVRRPPVNGHRGRGPGSMNVAAVPPGRGLRPLAGLARVQRGPGAGLMAGPAPDVEDGVAPGWLDRDAVGSQLPSVSPRMGRSRRSPGLCGTRGVRRVSRCGPGRPARGG